VLAGDAFQHAVDRDFLIVSWRAFGIRKAGRQKRCFRRGRSEMELITLTFPQFGGAGKVSAFALGSRSHVNVDNFAAVAGVREAQAEHLGIVPCLLDAVLGGSILRLGFDYGDRVVRSIAENVVGALAASPLGDATDKHHSSIGKSSLFVDSRRRVVPSRSLKQGHDEAATGVSLSVHARGTAGNGGADWNGATLISPSRFRAWTMS
jgi:hypothetical protein